MVQTDKPKDRSEFHILKRIWVLRIFLDINESYVDQSKRTVINGT